MIEVANTSIKTSTMRRTRSGGCVSCSLSFAAESDRRPPASTQLATVRELIAKNGKGNTKELQKAYKSVG